MNKINFSNLRYWKNDKPPNNIIKTFRDQNFPANENSLIGKDKDDEFIDKINGAEMAERIKVKDITWKRLTQIFKDTKYLLFEGEIEMADINQGSLGDCYFLSSVAALTQYPNLIYKMFRTKSINPKGFYEIVFFIDGHFQIVVIDDYLPVNKKTNYPVYARPNKNELWVCLLEKAWAKVNGGYSNIIKGWMRHVLQTFTGFSNESYNHTKMKPDQLWSVVNYATEKNCIMSASSRKGVVESGLQNSHAYTLIGTKEITSKGEIVKLCRMRNPWGYREWKGDWSDESDKWGEEELNQVKHLGGFKDDGTFWISFDDYYSHFIVTDICFLMHNSHSKSFMITEKDDEIKKGQVFNVFLESDGVFSVSVIRKMWRFNRELKNAIVPSFVLMVQYSPNESGKSFFKKIYADYDSHEDFSITKELNAGYYLIYAYQDYENSTACDKSYYVVKFDSPVMFKYSKMPSDELEKGFPLLKQILMLSILKEKGDNNEEKVSIVQNYKNTGIGHKLIANHTNKWIKYTDNISNSENMFMLSPYNEKNNFTYYIPPKKHNIILLMIFDSKEKTKMSILPKREEVKIGEDIIEVDLNEYANDEVKNEEITSLKSYYDRTSMSLEKASEKLKFEELDMSEMTFDKLSKLEEEEPDIIIKLKTLRPEINDKDLSWVVKKYKDGRKYIGQVNIHNKKEGRGALIDGEYEYIGYFTGGEMTGKGTQYDIKDGREVYTGEFKEGKRNGKGKLFYKNGDVYEGNFEDDRKEGTGKYIFSSGAEWEGLFVNDKMDGEGDFKGPNGKTKKVKYIKGKLIK